MLLRRRWLSQGLVQEGVQLAAPCIGLFEVRPYELEILFLYWLMLPRLHQLRLQVDEDELGEAWDCREYLQHQKESLQVNSFLFQYFLYICL